MSTSRELPVSALYRSCDLRQLDFETTNDLAEATGSGLIVFLSDEAAEEQPDLARRMPVLTNRPSMRYSAS